ncbi:MAG: UGMP family protein [Euryarchaeota archaeon]|nr:UGMP family protein [Euryarchaeota archaeon]
MSGVVVGVESTAHTLSLGFVGEDGTLFSSETALFKPEQGGIHPREAADHHSIMAPELISRLLSREDFDQEDIVAVSFSQGPGLGPCLRIGASVARSLSSVWNAPLIGVNHCVAHIEVGRNQTGCEDPVLLYASGGNTQVIARAGDRYRVLGETLDIGIGNMLDKFARHNGIPFPGGPVIEKLSSQWIETSASISNSLVNLPYGVHGTDLAFSGLLTSAISHSKSLPLEQVCYSLQEHSFSSCIEVAERAMAHTGKKELLLGGGVACNERLREMSKVMCEERGGEAFWPEKQYCVDNGTMIAELGRKEFQSGRVTELQDSAIDPSMRTDSSVIAWT